MTNSPEPGRREQRHGLHEVRLPRPLRPGRLPSAVHRQRLRERRQRAGLRAVVAPRPQHRARVGRQKIAGYLIMLARLGVAGFRIDAAKHIQQVELDDILAIVDSTLTAEGRPVPYVLSRSERGAGRSAGAARLLRRRVRDRAARPTSPNSPSSASATSSGASAGSTSHSSTPTARRETSSRRPRGG